MVKPHQDSFQSENSPLVPLAEPSRSPVYVNQSSIKEMVDKKPVGVDVDKWVDGQPAEYIYRDGWQVGYAYFPSKTAETLQKSPVSSLPRLPSPRALPSAEFERKNFPPLPSPTDSASSSRSHDENVERLAPSDEYDLPLRVTKREPAKVVSQAALIPGPLTTAQIQHLGTSWSWDQRPDIPGQISELADIGEAAQRGFTAVAQPHGGDVQGKQVTSTRMQISLSDTPPSFEVDPYEHVDYLGHGAYGYVDKVREKAAQPSSSMIYARKVVRISSLRDREYLMKSVLNEFKILNRLNHRHVVKVLQIYQWKNCLSIIMSQVAETDLAEYLQKTDRVDEYPEIYVQRAAMRDWPVCLIQALDYLHEMKIKHKDLKPANILIMRGKILIADFGISKDLIDEETTASLGASGDIGTRRYCAPEGLANNRRRGRSTDIYAMGCIFLEISTVLLAPPGDLQKWPVHQERCGSTLYSRSGPQILQWIHYLRIHASRDVDGWVLSSHINEYSTYYDGIVALDLSYLMLDPNPKTRITARQVIQILRVRRGLDNGKTVRRHVCENCRIIPDIANPNLPMHSEFNDYHKLSLYEDPDDALVHEVALNWETAKKLWLQSHMWW